MSRTDLHAFKGYDVVENDNGGLSVMVPFRDAKNIRRYRPEGDLADRRELAAYVHANCMGWMNGKPTPPERMKPGPKPKASDDPTRTTRMNFTLTPAAVDLLRANAGEAGMSAALNDLILERWG